VGGGAGGLTQSRRTAFASEDSTGCGWADRQTLRPHAQVKTEWAGRSQVQCQGDAPYIRLDARTVGTPCVQCRGQARLFLGVCLSVCLSVCPCV
jgi:hypothetical protein